LYFTLNKFYVFYRRNVTSVSRITPFVFSCFIIIPQQSTQADCLLLAN
jgi:hypothetical protein